MSRTEREGVARATTASLDLHTLVPEATQPVPPCNVTTSSAVAQWPSQSTQIPGPVLHSLSALHGRQTFVVVSQTGDGLAHFALSRHWTQVFFGLLQTL